MKYYSVQHIADLYDVSNETVRRWIRDKKLIAESKRGRTGIRVSNESLIEYNNKYAKDSDKKDSVEKSAMMALLAAGGVIAAGPLGLLGGALAAMGLSELKKKMKDSKLKNIEKKLMLEKKKLRLLELIVSIEHQIDDLRTKSEEINSEIKNLEELGKDL